LNDLIAVAARNNILQSEAVLAALGAAGVMGDYFWSNPHGFDIPYAHGATLGQASDRDRQRAAIKDLTAARSSTTVIMDSWAAHDLTSLGYRLLFADEWLVRASTPVRSPERPEDLSIERIETATVLAAFEAASMIAFGDAPADKAGTLYAPTLLDDENFSFFAGRVDGEPAGGVLTFREAASLGIYTLFTLPDYRGRGIGTALVETALQVAPHLPAVTNPSSLSRRIFAGLGFESAGPRKLWIREIETTTDGR
jgi:GNAT superfamily N-acetyltransferase